MKQLVLALLLSLPGLIQAQVRQIADNSFLLEEAFNQEEGVIQHIFTTSLSKDKQESEFGFSQEWPVFSQAHQLSFSVAGPISSGNSLFSSLGINYRYQWGLFENSGVFMSPRVSVIFPVGNNDDHLRTGFQANLPVSVLAGDHFIYHFNLVSGFKGMEKTSSGHTGRWDFLAGGSMIWMPAYSTNFLVEVLYSAEENVAMNRDLFDDGVVTVNPGMRFAIDFGTLQVVPGFSFPVEVNSSGLTGNTLFLYLSFEHPY